MIRKDGFKEKMADSGTFLRLLKERFVDFISTPVHPSSCVRAYGGWFDLEPDCNTDFLKSGVLDIVSTSRV